MVYSLPHRIPCQSAGAVRLHLKYIYWSAFGSQRGIKRFPAFLTCTLDRKYSGGKDKNKKGANEVFSSQGFSALNWCRWKNGRKQPLRAAAETGFY